MQTNLADSGRNPATGQTGGNRLRYKALSATLVLLLANVAPALAAGSYTLSLDPVAYDNTTRDVIVGEGRLTATLDGTRLTVSGNFSGLSSPATSARLGIGLDYGVPATEFFANLMASGTTSGTISGGVTLTPAQVAALNRRQLFLQLNSVRGTDGSLWGWFAPVADSSRRAGAAKNAGTAKDRK
jgi:hypothetical protein